MITLSEREHLVAEQYCKGLADKEVADSLQRSEWTIKAQKRDIYKKLGISKDTELVLYMFCERHPVPCHCRIGFSSRHETMQQSKDKNHPSIKNKTNKNRFRL